MKIASNSVVNCRESKIELINAKIEALPFLEQSFDFVCCVKSVTVTIDRRIPRRAFLVKKSFK